jgi:hypothetical protein
MKSILPILLFLPLCFFACTKEKRVDRFELLALAQKVDPTIEPIMAKDMQSGVRCSKIDGTPIYGPGCIGAFQVKVGPIDMVVLEFENEKTAKKEAERLGQWYFHNWVFDEVTGEPYLEDIVQKAFSATYAGPEKKAESN